METRVTFQELDDCFLQESDEESISGGEEKRLSPLALERTNCSRSLVGATYFCNLTNSLSLVNIHPHLFSFVLGIDHGNACHAPGTR